MLVNCFSALERFGAGGRSHVTDTVAEISAARKAVVSSRPGSNSSRQFPRPMFDRCETRTAQNDQQIGAASPLPQPPSVLPQSLRMDSPGTLVRGGRIRIPVEDLLRLPHVFWAGKITTHVMRDEFLLPKMIEQVVLSLR